jgi:TIR domain-containing protein
VDASLPARAPSRLRRWAVAFSVGFSVSWLLFFLPFLDPLLYLIPLSLKPGLGKTTALLFGLLTLVCREREHLGPGSLKVLRGGAFLGIVGLALLFVFQNRFIVRFNHANSSGRASEVIARPRLESCPGCETKTMSDEACMAEKSLDAVVLARCWDSSRRKWNQTAWTLAYLVTIGGAASFVGLLWVRLDKARPAMAAVTPALKIFLSFASPDREIAEKIQLALLGAGHVVFFDEASLAPGSDYNSRIRESIKECQLFIFLISPSSVGGGRYVHTELKLAKVKWPAPWGFVLPVMIQPTDYSLIDPYLTSATILEPSGDIAAEVAAAVESMPEPPSATVSDAEVAP